MNRSTLNSFIAASFITVCPLIVSGCRTVQTKAEVPGSVVTTQWLDKKFGFVADHETSKLLNKMMQRLGEAVYASASEASPGSADAARFKSFPWQAFVINANQPNAFSAGGGVIFITRGLIRDISTEAALASVIAHEMAHELIGHTREISANRAAGEENGVAFTLEHEIEADMLSLNLLARARYNPREALTAISDVTRSRKQAGVGVQDDWVSKRHAAITQQLFREAPPMPVMSSSREFNIVRERMHSSSLDTTSRR